MIILVYQPFSYCFMQREKKGPKKKKLWYSSWHAWQVTHIEIVTKTFFAAEKHRAIQRHKILRTDHAFIDPEGIDADIELSNTVCTFFIFHGLQKESVLN